MALARMDILNPVGKDTADIGEAKSNMRPAATSRSGRARGEWPESRTDSKERY